MRLSLSLVLLALGTAPALAADDYQLGPDSQPQDNVPRGKVEKATLAQSRIFPGAARDYWIYVPSQYRADVPACTMVFQDGERFVKGDGAWRVPIVFDNLIHQKAMPVTIGVFVNPGVVPAPHANAQPRFNRSYEYDGLGDAYARFLLDELLPVVAKRYNLSTDPNCRAIGGSSSGGIAAFNVAFLRPDAFRRVFSSIGTYVGLRGGDAYPTLVRKSEQRPLRVFLQDGSNDNDGYGGSWWFANQAMLAALQFAGYEVAHAFGDGGHTAKHGAAVLPEALRFLWKGFPAAPNPGATKQPLYEVLSPEAAAGWQPVGGSLGRIGAIAAAADGTVYVSDDKAQLHRIDPTGKISVFAAGAASDVATGLAVAPDGRLLAAQLGRKRVLAYDSGGRASVLAEGVAARDLAVTHSGLVFATEPAAGRVVVLAKGTAPRAVATGFAAPSGLTLTPDQAFLYVADARGRFVTSFEVLPDGSLENGQPFCHLHLDDRQPDSGASSLSVDLAGRLYVATRAGIQFCDQAGRVNGIITPPVLGVLAPAGFGGPALETLFAASGPRLYRRATRTHGVVSAEAPVKPPAPRL
jgi:enterochelin esterase-like enzyme/sugar lactone lactonase YvrE